MKRILLSIFIILQMPYSYTATPLESLSHLKNDADFIDLSGISDVVIDLRYAGTNNFTKTNLYGSFDHAFLRKIAADKLRIAAGNLQKVHQGYKLLVFDATRPRSVQQLLWNHAQGTDSQRYVANPQKGSIHNFGLAIDLTILNDDGKELDMGTGFDAFDSLSQPALENKYLKNGKLTAEQIAHRKLLRTVMQDAGFIQLPLEWWHFDALPNDVVHKHYQIVE